MPIALHWYLPTHGDGRTLVQAGTAAQLLQETRRPDSAGTGRKATLAYLAQVARAAEESGFPMPSAKAWCHCCAAAGSWATRWRRSPNMIKSIELV
jgi:alkanesulfonate monooxygenase